MQVVTLFNLTHLLMHSLNTMSETIFSNSLIFQEFAKLKYTLNLKISESQNLTNAKISLPKVHEICFDSANFEVSIIYHYTAAKEMNQPLVVGENIFQQLLFQRHFILVSLMSCFIQ